MDSDSAGRATVAPMNSEIAGSLSKLQDVYKSRKDPWRATTYGKAAQTIKFAPPITCKKDLYQLRDSGRLKGLGEKTIAKIAELIDTGSIQRLDCLKDRPDVAVIGLFCRVWGIGESIAEGLYREGYRTLEDLERAPLSDAAKIGLKYFKDIEQRIPRAEGVAMDEHGTLYIVSEPDLFYRFKKP
jgi:DNA polymerase lambda